MNEQQLIKNIKQLKEDKNAVILAHYYQIGEIQDIADYIGDSLYLSKVARDTDAEVIVFCGVHFMAETAKILAPTKKVIIPRMDAGCPMANMAKSKDLKAYKNANPEVKIISYVNTTAEIKAISDVCCTSSNAEQIFNHYKNDKCIYVPDQNMGAFFKRKFSIDLELWPGFCYIHNRITLDKIKALEMEHPNAKLIVHPEMKLDIVDYAAYVGSTKNLLEYIETDDAKEYIVGTEEGIIHQMKKRRPDATFIQINQKFFCRDMKKITLTDLHQSLTDLGPEMILEEHIIKDARKALDQMFEITK